MIEQVSVISCDAETEWVTVREKAAVTASAKDCFRMKVPHVP